MTVRTKIRIFYVQCPKLDEAACSLLLLSQNSQQNILEFEIHYPQAEAVILKNKVALKTPIAREEMLKACKEIAEYYDIWVAQNVPLVFKARPEMGNKSIFITEVPLEGNFYSKHEGDVAVISIAGWNENIAPPSVVEFILRIVQRNAISFLWTPYMRSHYATRGCIFDFNQNLLDTKNKILLSYICEDCCVEIARRLDEESLDNIKQMVDLKWVGEVDKSGSIANILKKSFKYDLELTKGLRPTWRERASELLQTALIQQPIAIIVAIVIAVLLFIFQLK